MMSLSRKKKMRNMLANGECTFAPKRPAQIAELATGNSIDRHLVRYCYLVSPEDLNAHQLPPCCDSKVRSLDRILPLKILCTYYFYKSYEPTTTAPIYRLHVKLGETACNWWSVICDDQPHSNSPFFNAFTPASSAFSVFPQRTLFSVFKKAGDAFLIHHRLR